MQNLLSALANLIASVSVFTASSAKSAAVQTHALSLPQFGCKLMSLVTETWKNKIIKLISLIAHYQIFGNHVVMLHGNYVFSHTWPASMQIYWNKRKRLRKKRVKLPHDWFRTGFGGWKLQMLHSRARWFTPKPYPMLGLKKSVQLPHPRTTPKLHFPVNQLKMPYLYEICNNLMVFKIVNDKQPTNQLNMSIF